MKTFVKWGRGGLKPVSYFFPSLGDVGFFKYIFYAKLQKCLIKECFFFCGELVFTIILYWEISTNIHVQPNAEFPFKGVEGSGDFFFPFFIDIELLTWSLSRLGHPLAFMKVGSHCYCNVGPNFHKYDQPAWTKVLISQSTIEIKSWSTASAQLSAYAHSLQTHKHFGLAMIFLCSLLHLTKPRWYYRIGEESTDKQTKKHGRIDWRYQVHYLPALRLIINGCVTYFMGPNRWSQVCSLWVSCGLKIT